MWSWAAVGAVLGGGLVFAGVSVAQLRRDIEPAAHPPVTPAQTTMDDDDDALAALAEHKQESARDLRSLLAAQQVVWRFFAATTAREAEPLIAGAESLPLPEQGLASPLSSVTLRSKRRLPEDAGTASQWAVTTTRFGELVVEISESSGEARLNWAKLAPQLSLDVRTAATP